MTMSRGFLNDEALNASEGEGLLPDSGVPSTSRSWLWIKILIGSVGLFAMVCIVFPTRNVDTSDHVSAVVLTSAAVGLDAVSNSQYVPEDVRACYKKILELDSYGQPTFGHLDKNFHAKIKTLFVNRSGSNPNLEWCSTAPPGGVGPGTWYPDARVPAKPCRDVPKPDGGTYHSGGYYEGDGSPHCSTAKSSQDGPCTRGYDLLMWPEGHGIDCSTPRILFVHGGSWSGGSPWDQSYNVHLSKIAYAANAVVMLTDYPAIGAWTKKTYDGKQKYVGDFQSIQDHIMFAWKWLASHGPNGVDCSSRSLPPMFIAGDSSGGGTAMSFVYQLNSWSKQPSLWKEKDVVKPSGAFFESPWTNLMCNTPTYFSNNFAAGPTLEQARKHPGRKHVLLTGDLWFNGVDDWTKHADKATVGVPSEVTQEYKQNALWYCGVNNTDDRKGTCGSSGDDLKDPYASPYWADPSTLVGLPPLFFVTSATEILAGDTTILASAAAKHGVSVTAEMFYGMWHTFPQWSEGCNTGMKLSDGVRAIEHMAQFVTAVTTEQRKCPHKTLGGGSSANIIMRSLHGTGDSAEGVPKAIEFQNLQCH